MRLRLKIALWLERWRRQNLKTLHPLQQLFWESTLRCNVHCLHCGSDCISSVTTPDMPAEDFLRVIDEEVTPHVNPHELMIVIDKKINRFIVMCVEQYAASINQKSDVTYSRLHKAGIIDELKNDYEDMHGMSTYSLNEYIDKRLLGGTV